MSRKSSPRFGRWDESDAKKLLVIEDDESQRNSIRELIGNETAHPDRRGDGRGSARASWSKERFDCVVLDLIAAGHVGLRVDR